MSTAPTTHSSLHFPTSCPTPVQKIPEKEVAPFVEAEHELHPNKKRAREGEAREGADAVVGQGDLEAGRFKRDKIMRHLLGKHNF